MKKIFAVLFLLIVAIFPFNKITNLSAETTSSNVVKVVSDFCYLYLTTTNLSSSGSDNIRVEYGTELELIDDEGTGKKAGEVISTGDYKFYYVQYKSYKRYVLISNVVSEETNTSLKKTLDSNAKILNDKTKVYKTALATEENRIQIGENNVELQQFQEIKIIDGYDKNKEFHKIMFEENGEILTGYVKTSDILVEGFNGTIILIVFIFVLIGSIVLSIVLSTRKKRKKLKAKEQKNNS